jgi:hypothetical protein
MAETQPKLQPALLRLSAIISQYFIRVQIDDGGYPNGNTAKGQNALNPLMRGFVSVVFATTG